MYGEERTQHMLLTNRWHGLALNRGCLCLSWLSPLFVVLIERHGL